MYTKIVLYYIPIKTIKISHTIFYSNITFLFGSEIRKRFPKLERLVSYPDYNHNHKMFIPFVYAYNIYNDCV